MKHINIPIFIPHLGCPNQCIFCNQRFISGSYEFKEKSVTDTIESVLSTVKEDYECEIAFFGGSFTGIERSLMLRLLDIAQKYVDLGKVNAIRMSTRPDYINDEIIDILKKYTISIVELGIQTMNDDILKYLKRGHTVADSEKAMLALKKNNIKFVGQMMVGLPMASVQDEIFCAEKICEFGASGSRIYPTIVFKNTELEQLFYNGKYTPISDEEAVIRSANILRVFHENDVPCIRIGLCDSENLHSESSFVAGPNSPSIGEMVKSKLYYDILCEKMPEDIIGKSVEILCRTGDISQVVGNKRKNIISLKEKFHIKNIKVKENISLKKFDVKITEKED